MNSRNFFRLGNIKKTLSARGLLARYYFYALFMVFISCFGQVLMPTPALSAEMGYIRLGDDYKFRKDRQNRGYRWCEQLCAKDDKCKSWTYLRPSSQCRLKSAVAPKYKNGCCVSGEKKGELNSSSQRLCRQYANKAIRAYEENLVENCGFSGRKWSGDFALHFDWCMDATVAETKEMHSERKDDLAQCKRETSANGGNVSCRQYARRALKQQQTNLDNKCGFNNRLRWRSDFNYYRRWCRENSVQERNKQDKLKQEAIARCLHRGGGSFIKRCDTHARASVKQIEEASQNGCGFRDQGRWSRKFSDHYQFCVKNNSSRDVRNKVLKKARARRTKEIKQCKAQFGGGWGNGEGGGFDDDMPRSPRGSGGGVEFGTLRLGADYSFKIAPKGSDYLWCEDSCRSDPRCKAWTFIKSTRQCRLKYNRGTAVKNDCCVAGRKSEGQQANSKSKKCLTYAETVLSLYDQSLKNNCYFDKNAWNNQFKDHYRYCMRKNVRTVEDDLDNKKALLKQCKAGEWQLDRRCSAYGKQAVSQNKMNLNNKCGFTRRSRWHSGFTRHYDWCSNHSRYEREDQNYKRQRFLAACLNRGGGRYSKACDAFSQAALVDVKKAQDLNCGLTGKDWSLKFKDHYQWCLNADSWQRVSEAKTRARSLKRCKANGGGSSQATARCNHFARLSAEQARSNSTNRCGFTFGRWGLSDTGNFEKWCMKATPRERAREFKSREDDLKNCFARFTNSSTRSDNSDKSCDAYARKALKQYREGQEKECRLRGEEWSDEYDDHYNWCLKASKSRRRRLIFSRTTVLKTCKLTSFFNFGN